ncbi:fungal-specific transcription factor domain-containing protein [Aspergillus ambiguus]|uniref:fungal specific transcription factor domain-containing protein n=1 Tax=Aspergillus ambiguus TaxID=176160 RepID=UPI003CCD2B54
MDDPAHYKRQHELRAGIGVANPKTGNFQFYGPSSGFCFLQRVYQRIMQSASNESLLNRRSCSIPDALQKWGMERFMFAADTGAGDPRRGPWPTEAFLPRALGDHFIDAYFKIMHPQMPVLVHSEILESWDQMWETPVRGRALKNQEILFMVLAIGSRVVNLKGKEPEARVEGWAEYFSSRASEGPIFLQEPSVKGMHLLLLKTMYSLQLMRQNDAYLYLGHASRTAMVLGLHRSQVTNGREPHMHRLRLTFWIMFVFERISSVYMGRPSALSENQIDTAYPEDLPYLSNDRYHSPSVECAWVRAMAEIAKLADRVSIDIYSPASIKSVADMAKVHQTSIECDAALQTITRTLPPYLHFFDESVPIGDDWQEIQRISLGFSYYVVRMLLYRPALVLTTFFNSTAEAQQTAESCVDLRACIDASTSAARNLVNLAYDVYFRRFPDIRYDGALASFIVSACITLLYDVLNLGTDPDRARGTFAVVERGIRCLDEIEHAGYTTGKAMSVDLMKVAKQAVSAADPVVDTNQALVDSFPWLDWTSGTTVESTTTSVPTPYTFPQDASLAGIGTLAGDTAMLTDSEVNYLWMGNGFDPSTIPGCLY